MPRVLRRTLLAALTGAAAFSFAGDAAAQATGAVALAPEDAACAAAAYQDGNCVVVRIDHLRRISFDAPVRQLLIGNPAIADATMLSTQEAVVTAKMVGTTNMIFIAEDGAVIADLEIMVLEGADRRVTLRRGPRAVASYQCAPRCERSLSLGDSVDAHQALTGVISTENAMIADAVGEAEAEE